MQSIGVLLAQISITKNEKKKERETTIYKCDNPIYKRLVRYILLVFFEK